MKITIENKTSWSTNDLRAIARAALEAAGATNDPWRCTVYVHVSKRRAGLVHGKAWIGRRSNPQNWVLFLPRPESVRLRTELLNVVCCVAHHEALHAVGARHEDMTEEQRYCRQTLPWASSLRLRTKAELRPSKPELAPEERREAAFEDKLTHVRSMHKRSLTRLKRALTFEKKWRRRLKMLERRNDGS